MSQTFNSARHALAWLKRDIIYSVENGVYVPEQWRREAQPNGNKLEKAREIIRAAGYGIR